MSENNGETQQKEISAKIQDNVATKIGPVTKVQDIVTSKRRPIAKFKDNVASKREPVAKIQDNVQSKRELVAKVEDNVTSKRRPVAKFKDNVQSKREPVAKVQDNVIPKRRPVANFKDNVQSKVGPVAKVQDKNKDLISEISYILSVGESEIIDEIVYLKRFDHKKVHLTEEKPDDKVTTKEHMPAKQVLKNAIEKLGNNSIARLESEEFSKYGVVHYHDYNQRTGILNKRIEDLQKTIKDVRIY